MCKLSKLIARSAAYLLLTHQNIRKPSARKLFFLLLLELCRSGPFNTENWITAIHSFLMSFIIETRDTTIKNILGSFITENWNTVTYNFWGSFIVENRDISIDNFLVSFITENWDIATEITFWGHYREPTHYSTEPRYCYK